MHPSPNNCEYIDPKRELQAPPLREKMRELLLRNGLAPALVQRYIDWCKDFVIYHLRRPPEDMGALEVEQYLQHVREQRGRAVEEARAALTTLYRDVLGKAQTLEPRLLDRVRACCASGTMPCAPKNVTCNGSSATSSFITNGIPRKWAAASCKNT